MSKLKVGDWVVVNSTSFQSVNRGDVGLVAAIYDWFLVCGAEVQFMVNGHRIVSLPFADDQLELAGPYAKYHAIAREICHGEV